MTETNGEKNVDYNDDESNDDESNDDDGFSQGQGRQPCDNLTIRREFFLFHHPYRPQDNNNNDDNKLESHYKLGRQIDSGSFGQVFLVTHRRTHHQRAMKRLPKSKVTPERFEREILILRTLDHPNVLRLFESFEDEFYYYIITELATGGNLYDAIAHQPATLASELAIGRLLQNVLMCINHCHAKGTIHGDIKPENILLAPDDVQFERLVLCDFGLAQFYDPHERRKRCIATTCTRGGTPQFVAPEILRAPGSHNPKSDVWSVGVLAFLLMTGHLPFVGTTVQEMCTQIIKHCTNHFDEPAWQNITPLGKEFVRTLLTVDVEARSAAQQALEHPYMDAIRQASSGSNGTSHNNNSNDNPFLLPSSTSTLSSSWNQNLIRFSAQQKLKQATSAFMVAQLTFQSQKKVIDDVFRTVDTNADGLLCHSEIKAAFRCKGTLLSPHELEDLFERVDMDQNGVINYWEFLAATLNTSTMLCLENLKMAFEMFDQNKNGSIAAEDLKTLFCRGGGATSTVLLMRTSTSSSSLASVNDDKDENNGEKDDGQDDKGPLIDENVIEAIIKQVDENGDGEISFEEFAKMMQQNIVSAATKRPHSSLD